MSRRTVQFRTTQEDAGRRLDQVLAAHVPELSRRQARVLLDIGGVFVDRARVKVASRTVRAGQLIEANLGGALERATKAVGSAARAKDRGSVPSPTIVFEDEDIVVVDKPAGLVTAPTPESDRNTLVDLLRQGGRDTLLIVHRIDLHTSGLLVVAKSELANQALSERFRTHDVTREYIAVVQGRLAGPTVTVRTPVAGRAAVTHLRVIEHLGEEATVLSARLETGRTHQIRIHCRELGHPVLGDGQYGRRTPHDPPRMALHAATLGFAHPRAREIVTFASALPGDLAAWLAERRAHVHSPASGDDA